MKHKCKYQYHKTPAVFTLVELLVVIGIIAILMTLLLPSLKKAKDMAAKSACASNMKQLTTASILYITDYDTWLPCACFSGGFSWNQQLDPYCGNNVQVSYCPKAEFIPSGFFRRNIGIGINSELLGSYVGGAAAWCPDTPVKLNQIKHPTIVSMFSDAAQGTSQWAYYANWPQPVFERHRGMANFGFVDGHVKPYTVKNVLNEKVAYIGWNGNLYYNKK